MMPTYGMKKYVTMPDGSNVRHYIAGVMSEVQGAMLENAEDNTKSFFALIRVRLRGLALKSLHTKSYPGRAYDVFLMGNFKTM